MCEDFLLVLTLQAVTVEPCSTGYSETERLNVLVIVERWTGYWMHQKLSSREVNKAHKLTFRQVITSTNAVLCVCVFVLQPVKPCISLRPDGSYYICLYWFLHWPQCPQMFLFITCHVFTGLRFVSFPFKCSEAKQRSCCIFIADNQW